MISSKFNYIVLVKYSSLKSPKFFLTSLKNLKINELVFFYKNKKKKISNCYFFPNSIRK